VRETLPFWRETLLFSGRFLREGGRVTPGAIPKSPGASPGKGMVTLPEGAEFLRAGRGVTAFCRGSVGEASRGPLPLGRWGEGARAGQRRH